MADWQQYSSRSETGVSSQSEGRALGDRAKMVVRSMHRYPHSSVHPPAREAKMGSLNKKQASLLVGVSAGAAFALLTDAARARGKKRKTVKTNHQLAAQVCVDLEEAVDHPKGIQVFADDGQVILRGVALRDELDELIDTAEHVAGVAQVTNQLDVVESPGKVEPLQA